MSLRTTPATRYDSFDFYRTSYKKIGDHEIEVNVLIPKDIMPGKHPLLVRWHGGGLTAGTAAYPDWFAAFLVPFIHRHKAIAIFPNYRLAPEHTGNDILEDIADFWTWFKSSLPTYVASKKPSTELDFSKVLVTGDSAGGWCALQSILSEPQSTIKACLLQYPVTNRFPTSPDDIVFGEAIPSKEVLEEFLASIKPGATVSSITPPERNWVATMLRAHGRWDEFFGTGEHIMPDTRIEDAKFFVPTYILHGKDDSNVPVQASHAFVDKAKKLFPETRFELVTPPGDHGCDEGLYEEDTPWLKELLKGVEQDWTT